MTDGIEGSAVQKLTQLDRSVATDRPAVLQGQIRLVAAQPRADLVADVLAGEEDGRAARRRAPGTAGARRLGERGITEPRLDALHRQAEHLRRELREDGVGAGADIGHVGLDHRLQSGTERDPRFRFGKDVDPNRRSHAHADQPLAVPDRAGRGAALDPAEAIRAAIEGFGELVRRERDAARRVLLRDVALSELDRIDAGLFGQLVHGVLQRRHADRLAGCAHRACTSAMDARDLMADHAVLAPIEKRRRLGDRLGEGLARQVGD